MKKINKIFLGVFIISSILSCSSTLKNKNSNSFNSRIDTIFASLNYKEKNKNDTCLSISNLFYKRFGVIISDYYIIKDSLALDLNYDSIIDTLIVLSPLNLEINYSDCQIDSSTKRLLVEIINDHGKARIRNIYSNLISNSGGVLSHYNGIFKTKNGFKIVHQAGARYSWLYSMEFSFTYRNKLTLKKIIKICSFDGFDKTQEFNYNQLPVDNINMSDTLKNQCNCDLLWSELETNSK